MSEAVNRVQLLANVARFLRETLRRDKAGRKLAASLGLHDHQVLERFQAGYANGSLLQAVPSKGALRDHLKEIGLINAEGQETAAGCLLVPAHDEHDNVAGFVAIPKAGPEMRFPPELPYYLLNREAFAEKAAVLVDSAKSANPADEERAFIEKYRLDKAYLAADLPETLRLLQKLEIPCYRLALNLPATQAQVEQAMKAAEPIGESVGPDAVVRVQEDDLIRFECGSRTYELRELAPGDAERLRVRLKAHVGERFHLDTLDLYAGRSRAGFARLAAQLFGVSEGAVEGDLCLMIRKLEAMRQARKAESRTTGERYVMTPDEEAEAREFLKQPDLLNRIVKDLESLGYIGEEANKKLGYLITISRKLESPLSGVIISRAAAGKSRLLEVLAELMPPEDLVSYTRITPQALYYAENRNLKHKLVVTGEDEGLLGSDYALRELISSKKIRLAAPVKDTTTGKMKTVEYEVEGPIALLFSTTQPAIHYENATRCFMLSLDESREQTERVMRYQLARKSLEGFARTVEGRALRRLHRNAQRLLRPLFVVNPLAGEIRFPSHRIESRRDHEKYLTLIEAIALLHQHQREIKKFPCDGRELEYIEATKEDIAEADRLMSEAQSGQDAELSKPSRKLLALILSMVQERAKQQEMDPRAFQFNRRDIREYTGWSDNQIKAHIKRLEELQYLLVRTGDRGKLYRYELGAQPEEAQTGTSCQPVGQKLGGPQNAGLDEKPATSWEVGPIPGKGYRGADKEAASCHV
jgi:hypothetical protein